MMTFEDYLRATIAPTVREAVREELRSLQAQTKPVSIGEYMSIATAANIADCTPDSIRAWIKAGKLPRHHAGRELRVRRDELERFLAAETPGQSEVDPEQLAETILSRRR